MMIRELQVMPHSAKRGKKRDYIIISLYIGRDSQRKNFKSLFHKNFSMELEMSYDNVQQSQTNTHNIA